MATRRSIFFFFFFFACGPKVFSFLLSQPSLTKKRFHDAECLQRGKNNLSIPKTFLQETIFVKSDNEETRDSKNPFFSACAEFVGTQLFGVKDILSEHLDPAWRGTNNVNHGPYFKE